jgi:hypothetical protein
LYREKVKADRSGYHQRLKAEGRSKPINRAAKLRQRYGLKVEEYEWLFAMQKGRCAICRRPERRFGADGLLLPLSVDHCHSTNRIRGLLCWNCNQAIGRLGDDPEILQRAVVYLTSQNNPCQLLEQIRSGATPEIKIQLQPNRSVST